MASVEVSNIGTFNCNDICIERTHESIGDLAFHPELIKIYFEKKYNEIPLSKQEADAAGKQGWNGLSSSIANMHVYFDGNRNHVTADIFPTRYFYGKAMTELVKRDNLNFRQRKQISPDMANVSMLAIVQSGKDYFLLTQVRGKSTLSEKLHGALFAGGIDGEDLLKKIPLEYTLRKECEEELGIKTANYINEKNRARYPSLVIEEREYGLVNLAFIEKVDLKTVLDMYSEYIKNKDVNNLETIGLALVPLQNNTNKGIISGTLPDISSYMATTNGVVLVQQDRPIINYCQAVLKFSLSDQNRHYLLERAGF